MLILQRLRSYHEAYLQEVHEGDPRSAEMISRAIKPNYAIITNVGIAHKENFASEEDLKAYTEIVAGMPKDGILYVNGDDEALMDSVRKYVGSSCIRRPSACMPRIWISGERLLSDGKQITFDVGYAGKTTPITFPRPLRSTPTARWRPLPWAWIWAFRRSRSSPPSPSIRATASARM